MNLAAIVHIDAQKLYFIHFWVFFYCESNTIDLIDRKNAKKKYMEIYFWSIIILIILFEFLWLLHVQHSFSKDQKVCLHLSLIIYELKCVVYE